MGRGIHFPIALEGALKLKEISYIHAEGYPAGEMKHGPNALIDENLPVVVLATRDPESQESQVHYEKTLSNIQEVKARSGIVVAIACEGDDDVAKMADHLITIPHTRELLFPLLEMIPAPTVGLLYRRAARLRCRPAAQSRQERHSGVGVTVNTHNPSLTTKGKGLYPFTSVVATWLRDQPVLNGILVIFVQHTSCSLVVQENADPDVVLDLRDFFERLVPEESRHYRHTLEGPDDMTSHIRASSPRPVSPCPSSAAVSR